MFRFRDMLLATTALMPLGMMTAAANPLGSQVVVGTANVQGQGTSAVTVIQSTDKAIINWQTFNIGAGETTQFVQPNASSVTLNRVTGSLGASVLDGTLTANGRVFLVNPDGILVGASSKINTGSFLGTTNDIRNADFMADRYRFNIPGRPDAVIVNLGTITAQNGGFAALVAPGVRNTGTITANLGTVGLAAGNNFSLDFYGDRLITLGVNDSIAAKVIDVATGRPLNALVQNDGKLKANGGRIELTSAAARQVVDSVINNTGVIEANSIGSKNGMIVLGAATTATKPAGAPVQTVKLSGTISAAGKRKNTKGGAIIVSGEDIRLTSATIDASGQNGGGKVLIGGDVGGGYGNSSVAGNSKDALESFTIATASTVNVNAATRIDASAKSKGNGGKVVVWSDQATTFYGTIRAQGGLRSGDGGFVETSGHQSLTFNGLVDTSALKGKNGTLLLDPQDATIDVNPGIGVITVSSIQNALLSGDLIVSTGAAGGGAGNITVAANISWANANALTLSAYKEIFVNASVTNTGGAAVNLRADNSGTGVGTVTFGSGGMVSTTGAVLIYYNPTSNPAGSMVNGSSYTGWTNYSGNVTGGGALTAYMLVNSVYDLQNIQNSPFGVFALGRDIEAGSSASWNSGAGLNPIGMAPQPFAGVFDGMGHTISHLTISSSADNVGLFAASFGAIRNVGLADANITTTLASDPSMDFSLVGALVGSNYGTIQNAFATGSVKGFVNPSSILGGLVGQNELSGSISRTYSQTSVSGNSANGGGLVGKNDAIITESFSTGAVVSSFASGGLVGFNGSTGMITKSYATGQVITTGGAFGVAGGLVGINIGLVDQAYATGSASGSTAGGNGGLVGDNGSIVVNFGGLTGAATSSYWNTQTSGQSASAGGVGLTTSQLSAALPSGFSGSVWGVTPSVTYPFLLWQPAGTRPVASGSPNPRPTPTPPQSLLPPGTSPFPTAQTAFFTPSSTQIANSTPQTSPLPNYGTIAGPNIYLPPPGGNIKVTTNVTTPAAGSALTSSLSRDLTAVNAGMDLNESYHLHDATLFHDIISTLGLNKDYSTDSLGYIYPSNYGTANREECVALVLALKPSLSQNTNNWIKGIQVELNGQQNPALQPGTAIATFNPNGSYPGATGELSDGVTIAHTAIFLGYATRNGQFGMYVLDQYTAHPGVTAQPAEIRFDPLTPAKANLYFSISTK